jgi:hypothetical protein
MRKQGTMTSSKDHNSLVTDSENVEIDETSGKNSKEMF